MSDGENSVFDGTLRSLRDFRRWSLCLINDRYSTSGSSSECLAPFNVFEALFDNDGREGVGDSSRGGGGVFVGVLVVANGFNALCLGGFSDAGTTK